MSDQGGQTFVQYDLHDVLGRIEKKVDDLSSHVRHETAVLSERVGRVESRIDVELALGQPRIAQFTRMIEDVEELKKGSVSREAIQHYKERMDSARHWIVGLAVTSAGLVVSVASLILAKL